MIQIQVVIDLPKGMSGFIGIWQMVREDANENEARIASALESRIQKIVTDASNKTKGINLEVRHIRDEEDGNK